MRAFSSVAATGAVSWRLLALATVGCLYGCEPKVVVGEYTCPAKTADAGASDAGASGASAADASAMPAIGDAIPVPWSTGFENRFCDYTAPVGFCFSPTKSAIVSSPVKDGHYAAAFTVEGEDGGIQQTRCVRQGVLPVQAYYGAWYYIPVSATNAHLWNLIHIQGAASPTSPGNAGTVDASLVNGTTGALSLVLHVFNNNLNQTAPIPIPIGSWFHIELYLKRASDATGEAALYQDGKRVADFANVVTDDTAFGLFYVGNLADSLTPPESTLYVDDVTIAATLGYTPPP